jgi:hypothetical protein
MALTVSLADNGDGSGAVATVAGSSGATVTVYARLIADTWTGAWANAGGRTGDGAVPLSLPTGVWFVYAATATVVSLVATVGVTDGAAAILTRCRQAISDRIKLLNLPALGTDPGRLAALNGRVYQQVTPTDATNVVYPCVILSPSGLAETTSVSTSSYDVVRYLTGVLVVEKQGLENHLKIGPAEKWRELIANSFRNQPLTGVPECSRVEVQYGAVVDANTLATDAKLLSALTLHCACKTGRGLGI